MKEYADKIGQQELPPSLKSPPLDVKTSEQVRPQVVFYKSKRK